MNAPDDQRPPSARRAAAVRVTIYYREPVYARTRGIPDREYRGTFEVTAHDADSAVHAAIAQFREAARRSSVGWSREITRVSIGEALESNPVASEALATPTSSDPPATDDPDSGPQDSTTPSEPTQPSEPLAPQRMPARWIAYGQLSIGVALGILAARSFEQTISATSWWIAGVVFAVAGALMHLRRTRD